jgi:hypothetical protein
MSSTRQTGTSTAEDRLNGAKHRAGHELNHGLGHEAHHGAAHELNDGPGHEAHHGAAHELNDGPGHEANDSLSRKSNRRSARDTSRRTELEIHRSVSN